MMEVKNKRSRLTYVAVFVLILSVLIGIYIKFQSKHFDITQAVPLEVHDFFNQHDANEDGYLSPKEFEFAYYALKENSHLITSDITQIELENFHVDIQKELEEATFGDDETILNLKTNLKQINFNSMKKFNGDQYIDDRSMYHLHGLKMWEKPNIHSANFSITNFSVFLPTSSWKNSPGKTWELIPLAMAGHSFQGKHLGQKRYLPPKPEGDLERTMLYLLSMLHKRPFLHMRFPPRGAVACLRAVDDEYYDIMFRLHPEFQLNEPPHFPFWFTPASFVGEIVMKKDGSHIEYFNMYLPTRKQLNIDMEWITSAAKKDGSHGQEVDIGFVEDMSISSTQPSKLSHQIVAKNTPSSYEESTKHITWTEEITHEEGYEILEKTFYPFKNVRYYPFNETFDQATKENKLIHHVLLWGSLDDQSCSGRTLREGPLESSPVIEILNNEFISSWSLVADLEDLTRDSGNPEIAKRAQLALDDYKFPVQSTVILPESGQLVHSVNANTLLDSSQSSSLPTIFNDPLTAVYVDFLNAGLKNASEMRSKPT